MAAKAGILFALKLGLELLELEVDVKNVWTSIAQGIRDRSYNGNIVRDIHLYGSWVRNFICRFVPRQCDRIADVLANYAKDIQQESWISQPPDFLRVVLLSDST